MTQSVTHPEAMYLHLAALYHLTWFSWLHRLLSLCPVLPLGYPDSQTYMVLICGSQKHSLWHSHIFYFHTTPGFYWPRGRSVHPIPALPTNIHAHTHLLNLLLSPGECGEYTGTKDTDACFCLALSHLRAAAARELAGAGAWAGHKATGTTGTPIWSSFGFRLWFCLPKICLPRQQIESGRFCPGIFWHLILFALPKA